MDIHGFRELMTDRADRTDITDTFCVEDWWTTYTFVVWPFMSLSGRQAQILKDELDVIYETYRESRSNEAKLFRQWYDENSLPPGVLWYHEKVFVGLNEKGDSLQLAWPGKIRDVFDPTTLQYDKHLRQWVTVDNLHLIATQMRNIVHGTAIYRSLDTIIRMKQLLPIYDGTVSAIQDYHNCHKVSEMNLSESHFRKTFADEPDLCNQFITLWLLLREVQIEA
jgi:hypothetical protein